MLNYIFSEFKGMWFMNAFLLFMAAISGFIGIYTLLDTQSVSPEGVQRTYEFSVLMFALAFAFISPMLVGVSIGIEEYINEKKNK